MLSNDNSTFYTAEITVPNGISLDSSADARYSQSGNTISFVEDQLADFLKDGYILDIPIDIPLNIDCSVYPGGNTLIDIPFNTFYTSNCDVIDLHCGDFEVQTHCGDAACEGPEITGFEANRNTAGWTDDTMTTRVTLDPDVHATKFYMPRDEMRIVTSAFMRNHQADNLFFEMTYNTNGQSGQDFSDILTFVDGTITINDLSSGTQTTAITVSPTIVTTNLEDNVMTFDLSSYRNIISPSYEYGEGLEQDVITLELNLVFADEFPAQNQVFEFHNFWGEFYSNDNGIKYGCDIYYDRAVFEEADISYDITNDVRANNCTDYRSDVQFSINSDVGRYENEYRPAFLWESLVYDLLPNSSFAGEVQGRNFPQLPPSYDDPTNSNNGFNVNEVGNILTITPGSALIQQNQGRGGYPRLETCLTSSSSLPPTSTFDATITYVKYPYSNNPEVVTITEAITLTGREEHYYISSPTPTVFGASEVVSFTVDLDANLAEAIDYNWLR